VAFGGRAAVDARNGISSAPILRASALPSRRKFFGTQIQGSPTGVAQAKPCTPGTSDRARKGGGASSAVGSGLVERGERFNRPVIFFGEGSFVVAVRFGEAGSFDELAVVDAGRAGSHAGHCRPRQESKNGLNPLRNSCRSGPSAEKFHQVMAATRGIQFLHSQGHRLTDGKGRIAWTQLVR